MNNTTPATAGSLLPDGVAIPIERRLEGHVLPLRRAVKHGTRELDSLAFSPLSGAHVRRAPPDWEQTDRVLQFAGQLTGLPDRVFDQLQGADIGDVIRATVASSWPMLDLPVQWEETWRLEARYAPGDDVPAPRKLPSFEGGAVLALEHPATGGRDTLSELRFTELTGKVARALPTDGVQVARLPWLVEQLTGAPAGVVDQLRGRDLNRALALAQLFFLAIRGTTATSG